MEALNPGPPDFNTSSLNHSASTASQSDERTVFLDTVACEITQWLVCSQRSAGKTKTNVQSPTSGHRQSTEPMNQSKKQMLVNEAMGGKTCASESSLFGFEFTPD